MTAVRVYTDGASWANGTGGWACLMFVDGEFTEGRYGGFRDTTNNQMELYGCIAGMGLLPVVQMERCKGCGVVEPGHTLTEFCEIQGTISRPVYENAVIVSDSQYCVKGATTWVHGWKQNGWKTADKKPVKNQSFWQQVDELVRRTGARFEWVKGHGYDQGNLLADFFAVEGKKQINKMAPNVKEWDNRITADKVANFSL